MHSGRLRLYILDTNVLTHDPRALLRFEEHDVLLPMEVLEELDAIKGGSSDIARNVREVSRMIEQILDGSDKAAIEAGLDMPGAGAGRKGRLFLDTAPDGPPAHPFGDRTPDNRILSTALGQCQRRQSEEVVLVTRDINLRIKARALGLTAEDYHTDRVVDDLSLLPTGMREVDDSLLRGAETGQIGVPDAAGWHPRMALFAPQAPQLDAQIESLGDEHATLARLVDYREGSGRKVWGVSARNTEQNFALNLLMDRDVDLVTLLGVAGTGKTLLTLAAGLAQTLDEALYKEILVTRATVPVGEDIGYLPGTEEEKMTPWMGALMDNLEVLVNNDGAGSWGRAATADLLGNRIKLRSMSFMRGRTFLNRYVIIDEAQNLTRKQMKTLLTRAGPGTKMVCLGNVAQIDTPYVTETTSGLTYAVDRFTPWPHAGHVTLSRGERSRLADFASDAL